MTHSRGLWRRLAWGALTRLRGRAGAQQPHAEIDPHAGYELWASTYGEVPNAFQQLEAEAIEGLMPSLYGERFLDLGCGKARLSRVAMDSGARRCIAVDSSRAMLTASSALRSPRVSRVQATAACLPFSKGSFDAIGVALTLGHVADLSEALTEMRRVLRPGGWLLISDFHPAATSRGWVRSFTDPETGRTFAISQHLHPLAMYREILDDLGFVIETLVEREFEGQAVIFVLRGRL